MRAPGRTDVAFRILVGLLSVFGAIILVLLLAMLAGLRGEVRELKAAVRDIEEQPAANAARTPLSLVEGRCTGCHTERKFAGLRAAESDWAAIVTKMSRLPDARQHFAPREAERLTAALQLFSCTGCHSAGAFAKLEAMTRQQRAEVLTRMRHKNGASLTRDQLNAILRSYEKLQGF
jgi:hypothetical protein